jgi:hypothetical protein
MIASSRPCIPDVVFARLNNQMPLSEWPRNILSMYTSQGTLSFQQRMTMVCFLIGNGCPEYDVPILLKHKLRDHAAMVHITTLLKSVNSGSYDSRWFYYNVHYKDYYYLNGKLASVLSQARLINVWNEYCHEVWRTQGRYPTMKEEQEFFQCQKV